MAGWFDEAIGDVTIVELEYLISSIEEIREEVDKLVAQGERASTSLIAVCKQKLIELRR